MNAAYVVVAAQVALGVVLAGVYFRRYELTRPPIGVLNGKDVAVMLTGIVATPYLYLILPLGVVAIFLLVVTSSVLYVFWEPILPARWLAALLAAAIVSIDVALALSGGTETNAFLAVNDLLVVTAAVGIANLLAQSGLRARSLAVVAAALTVYDVLAVRLGVMAELTSRLAELPFAPIVAWRNGGNVLGIGLGDVLLMAVTPLILRKAFGRRAGRVAVAVSLTTAAAALALVAFELAAGTLPVMVVLGPAIVLQYVIWIRLCRFERPTWEYLRLEPRRAAREVHTAAARPSFDVLNLRAAGFVPDSVVRGGE